MNLFRLIANFVRRHWHAYLASGAMLIGIAVLTVWIPRRVGAMVDGLVAGALSGAALAQQLALLGAMGVAIYLLRVGWRLQLFAAAFRLGVELRTQLYARLSAQGPQFFQQQRTGDLMALATNDVDAVELAAGEAFLAGFDGTLTLILVVAVMTLGVDWRLALIAMIPFPLMAAAFWVISRKVHEAWAESLDAFSALNDHVQQTVAGVRTLRALGLEARADEDFARLTDKAAAASFEAQRWEAAYEPSVGLTLTAATALTLGVGAWLVWQSQLSIGQLTSFTMYLGQLIWPMFAAGWVLSLIERGRAAWQRLDPMLRVPLTVEDHGTISELPTGQLKLYAVSFTYPGQESETLRDISLVLEAGKTLGVVGATGAGKSTLLSLILRHYAAQSGRIEWAGHVLDDFKLQTLRTAIAWVPQEAFLFSASIAENIALPRPDASHELIERAARLASVHDDIMRFPQGYATRVGERGITLSGGQRQRVAIARALLADAPLLLLDDALSAVDTGTETLILEHLRQTRLASADTSTHAARSTIVVSHRLSAVMDADQIIVLTAGRVTERGAHDALLARDGWYATQWRYQQLEASLDAA